MISLVFGFAFTGYLLQAYRATVVGTNVAGTVPAGGLLVKIIRGGPEIGGLTLSRFFAVHTYILPWSIVLAAGLHVFLLELAGPGGRSDLRLNHPAGTNRCSRTSYSRTHCSFSVYALRSVRSRSYRRQGSNPGPIPPTLPTTIPGRNGTSTSCSRFSAFSKDRLRPSARLSFRRSPELFWYCSRFWTRKPNAPGRRSCWLRALP